jgi:hypothetical protein
MNSTYNYQRLRELAAELNRPLQTLIALSDDNDPFFADRPGRRMERAQWFAELWQRLDIQHGVHVRRLHYLLCSTTGIIRPDGAPYANTHRDWMFLGHASADARFLNLVPADAFVDRRAAEPVIYIPDDASRTASTVIYPQLPSIDIGEQEPFVDYTPGEFEFPPLPSAGLIAPAVAEPYALELWCEKSTVNDVLAPLAQTHGVTLITGVGELSVTRCLGVVNRVRAHRRHTRILYISDHDPSGECMPVSVARKIEFLLRRDGLDDIDVQLNPLVLTAKQVADFSLPRIPIKDSDARKDQFEARYGDGAVELDALEALHPGALRQIVEEAIERYRAPARRLRSRITRKAAEVRRDIAEAEELVLEEHAAEVEELQDAWAESQTQIAEHQEAITAKIAECQAAIAEHQAAIEAELHGWQDRAAPVWERIADDMTAAMPAPDAIEWPELDLDDEDANPLFDSTRDYLDQMTAYKRYQGKPADRVEHVLTCEVCGRAFVRGRTTATACSKRCMNKRYRARNGGGEPPREGAAE